MPRPLRIVFCGTPEFAVPALTALHAAEHHILAAFTQPDRPAGRGRHTVRTPVAACADVLGVPVHQPLKLDADAQALLRELAPDVLVVVAYGLILPRAVLEIPPLGCINIHASLLPRWRGAAPIARAIEAGDTLTGVTLMQMDAGLDTGPMLCSETVEIGPATTAAELQHTLSMLGARMITHHLPLFAEGAITPEAQPAEGATYARKLGKDEARLDWSLPANVLTQRIRAFNPAPVAWTLLGEERLRVWNASLSAGQDSAASTSAAAPGTILAVDRQGLHVATGDGSLCITELQRPGGRVLAGAELKALQNLKDRQLGF